MILENNTVRVRKNSNYNGFTIVELLITIVIIALLSTIVFVSYRGVTAKANEAALVSDLTNASKKLSMYYAEYGAYPSTDGLNSSTNWCPTLPKPDNNYCLKFNTDTTAVYTSDTLTYTLNYTKGTISYEVTNSISPQNVTKTPITAVGAISGTAQIGQTLTAGAITPAGATVSYQWQSATTAGGIYTDIPNATSSTYIVSPNTMGKYIKVVVTSTGTYTGIQTSAATSTAVAADANWLTIGSQTWAKANLNVGTRIAGASNQTNNATTEKYCYSDTESNCTTYGGLYQWDEAMGYTNTEGAQGICPVGSHIPSDAEWKTLEMSLSGMTQATANATGWRGTDEGTKLKSGGSSSLGVLSAGNRTVGSFNWLSTYGYFWSSTELGGNTWFRSLGVSQTNIGRNTDTKIDGFSIRCLAN